MAHELQPIKIKIEQVELDCTRSTATKAFEETVRHLTSKYKVDEVTFKVKWEVRGSSTSTATHARLALHRQNLKLENITIARPDFFGSWLL